MTPENDLGSAITGFLLERFPLARKQNLREDTPLLESGLLDSLGILDVVAFVEGRFGIRLSDDDLVPENFQSIEKLAAFLKCKMNGASPTQL